MRLAGLLCGKPQDEVWAPAPETLEHLSSVLTNHTYGDRHSKMYHPEIMRLFGLGTLATPEHLPAAARGHAEFQTLISFLGVRTDPACCEIGYSHGCTLAKQSQGGRGPNDDSFSSAMITMVSPAWE